MLRIPGDPLFTDASSKYPYSDSLMSVMTFVSTFGDEVCMAKKVGNNIAVPRNYASGIGTDYRVRRPLGPIVPKAKARDDMQVRCIMESTALLQAGQSHVLRAPTGSGKTFMGLSIACNIGEATLIVCTKSDLMESWKECLIKLIGIPESEIGIAQGDQLNYKGKRFVLGMVHSLAMEGKYDDEFWRSFGMVIFDETHRMAADTFQQVCFRCPARLRLGLSATPKRNDGKNPVIIGHIGNVMVEGNDVPMKPRVIVQPTNLKTPAHISNGGDVKVFLAKMDKHLANHAKRNELIGRMVVSAYNKGRNIVIMSGSIAHLDTLHNVIGKQIGGQNLGRYTGGLSKDELKTNAHKRVVLATYQMCSEGTDFPHWDMLVMATPKSNVTQIIGRVLRKKEGKPQPIVLDLLDDVPMYQNFGRKRLTQYYAVGGSPTKLLKESVN